MPISIMNTLDMPVSSMHAHAGFACLQYTHTLDAFSECGALHCKTIQKKKEHKLRF